MPDSETPFGGAAAGRKRERFCQAVARGASGAEAARSAGYAPGNVRSQAHKLLREPAVAARIAALRDTGEREAARRRGELVQQIDAALARAAAAEAYGPIPRLLALKAQLYGLAGDGGAPAIAWPDPADACTRTAAGAHRDGPVHAGIAVTEPAESLKIRAERAGPDPAPADPAETAPADTEPAGPEPAEPAAGEGERAGPPAAAGRPAGRRGDRPDGPQPALSQPVAPHRAAHSPGRPIADSAAAPADGSADAAADTRADAGADAGPATADAGRHEPTGHPGLAGAAAAQPASAGCTQRQGP